MIEDNDLKKELKKSIKIIKSNFKKVAVDADKKQLNQYAQGKFDGYFTCLISLGFSIEQIDNMVMEALEEVGL
jgi:Holliday junction resolvasome RuvABC DNA-binding subunit